MPAPFYLIWHQFLKETREHRNSLIGILSIAAVYTGLAASGQLESIQTYWNSPLLTQNPLLPFMFTLAPGLFLVPFLAFADSCSEPDAFWVTKPLGATAVVGAKILWISVWLIGFPLLGEGIVVISLGGAESLIPVMVDFVLIRAVYFFTFFALASLFNQLFHFIIAALCIPFAGAILAATIDTFSPETSIVARRSPTAISTFIIWCSALPVFTIVVACFQYRYRVDMKSGALCALCVLIVCSVLTSKPVDLLDHPISIQQSNALEADKIAIKLHSASLIPKALTPLDHSRDQLELEVSITKTPPLSALLLNRIRLTIRTEDQEVVIEENSQKLNGYIEHGTPPERIFKGIISQLKDETKASNSIPGKIFVSFPPGEKISNWKDQNISIVGEVNFDLIDHYEFGRLEPKLDSDRESSVSSQGISMTMLWPKDTSRSRYIVFQYRHIAANFASNYHELRTRWNPEIIPWYFVFRDRTHNTYWEHLEGQNNEHCTASSFCALHVARSTATLPLGVNADEVIVYASRYLGTIQREFTISDITLQQKD